MCVLELDPAAAAAAAAVAADGATAHTLASGRGTAQMLGAVVKRYMGAKLGLKREDICLVSRWLSNCGGGDVTSA